MPHAETKETMALLKAMYAQEYARPTLTKGAEFVAKLRETKLARATSIVEEGLSVT